MIIYYSIHDNDFGHLMKRFSKGLWASIVAGYPLGYSQLPKPEDLKGYQAYFEADRLHKTYLREYDDENLSPKAKEYFIAYVKELFAKFVENNEDRDYLLKKFKTNIVDSITDEWQNGEAFYYFTTSNQTLNF